MCYCIWLFENRVLRRIFGSNKDDVTGEWRRLHNKERYALYSSPDIIRVITSSWLWWAEYVARMGESRSAYRALMGKPEGRRKLKRPRRRWEDNIKMDFREFGWGGEAWTGSIWLIIGTGGRLLWIRGWTFGFHKIREISWIAEDVLASQEGLCSMELLIYNIQEILSKR